MDIINRLKKEKIFVFRQEPVILEDQLRLWERIENSVALQQATRTKNHSNFKKAVALAAAIAMLIVLFWFLVLEIPSTESQSSLTYVEKSINYGEKLTITLTDGSVVKLNSGSTIKYPKPFSDDIREVFLEGEAFFDVKENPNIPFVVKAGDIHTTVLGTSFNVNAYSQNEHIEISLISGKVRLENTANAGKEEVVYLSPNRKAKFSKMENKIEVSRFDYEKEIAWKDGIIIFTNASEDEVLNKLRRWYGVDFYIINKSPQDWDLTAKFENNSLEHVLDVISYTAQFTYSINDKMVTINYLSNN